MTRQGIPQFYRQRFLLALLQMFNCELHRTDFQKYLFLVNQEFALSKEHYAFLPYNFGPFSFQAYADIRRLSDLGLLSIDETVKMKSSTDYLACLKDIDRIALERVYIKYGEMRGKDLIKDVYLKYPYYAVKSKIFADVVNEEIVLPSFETNQSMFSIGYEGRTIDQYLNTLVSQNVSTLIDVRKNPLSMKYGFSKSTLFNATKNLGIEYIHIPELGIESKERQNLNNFSDYNNLFDEYEVKILSKAEKPLKKIVELFDKGQRIALTCFEKDKDYCHRLRVTNKIDKETGCITRHL